MSSLVFQQGYQSLINFFRNGAMGKLVWILVLLHAFSGKKDAEPSTAGGFGPGGSYFGTKIEHAGRCALGSSPGPHHKVLEEGKREGDQQGVPGGGAPVSGCRPHAATPTTQLRSASTSPRGSPAWIPWSHPCRLRALASTFPICRCQLLVSASD